MSILGVTATNAFRAVASTQMLVIVLSILFREALLKR